MDHLYFWHGIRNILVRPWISEMAHIAKNQGMKALSDPGFLDKRLNLMVFGTSQALTVVFCSLYLYIETVEEKKEKVHASINQKSIGRLQFLDAPTNQSFLKPQNSCGILAYLYFCYF